jgi:hypothetical protein
MPPPVALIRPEYCKRSPGPSCSFLEPRQKEHASGAFGTRSAKKHGGHQSLAVPELTDAKTKFPSETRCAFRLISTRDVMQSMTPGTLPWD